MLKHAATSLFCILLLSGLVACGTNLQAAGLTPMPTLAPTVALTPINGEVSATATVEPTATEAPTEVAAANPTPVPFAPPNCGQPDCTKPGPAITQNLKGDVANGEKIFSANCAVCHGPKGQGGAPNPGSADGTVPSLNPIDEMFGPDNAVEFATHLDAYIEHGSHTDGLEQMPSWGDNSSLKPQQIADVIAYLITLNQP
ncbi:MAG: c-type cytochrome [Anaerolineae bacterium]